MSEQLITVGEATQRLGVTSDLPANKCLTKGEFDELSSKIPELAPNGVYIMHKDRFIVTKDNWTYSNEEASGVAVKTDNCSFVIAKTEINSIGWDGIGILINGCTTTTYTDIAITDYNGKQNTDAINKQMGIGGNPAATYCSTFEFTHGTKGYLPALGELIEANKNITEINECMSLIGGKLLYDSSSNYYTKWSSTQSNNNNAWSFNFKNKSSSSEYKGTAYTARPFSAFK
ncbi:hypothetical protein [Phocaeicola sp. HCN-6420]|uniref:hypothetical protein n=1 Tax=Phocaeicola sp. HCN-6420 TaxID=3134673 RepID=UPI0030BC60EE